MAQKYPSNWERCATCVYWTGPREVDYWGSWVTIASMRTMGRCMCRGSNFRIERDGNFVCSAYVKWPALQ